MYLQNPEHENFTRVQHIRGIAAPHIVHVDYGQNQSIKLSLLLLYFPTASLTCPYLPRAYICNVIRKAADMLQAARFICIKKGVSHIDSMRVG
jgi:hypothetical protein